jgi:hypothetical protein
VEEGSYLTCDNRVLLKTMKAGNPKIGCRENFMDFYLPEFFLTGGSLRI